GGRTQTKTGNLMGTPGYMAPEQAMGHPSGIGPPADVYALGAILYEMLTGRPPFRSDNVMEVLQQVLTQDPLPPNRLQPKLPRDLQVICLKCLQKDPKKRYASAEELADDLQRFLAGDPILARAASGLERFWRSVKRRPRETALVAACVVVGIALLKIFVDMHV